MDKPGGGCQWGVSALCDVTQADFQRKGQTLTLTILGGFSTATFTLRLSYSILIQIIPNENYSCQLFTCVTAFIQKVFFFFYIYLFIFYSRVTCKY